MSTFEALVLGLLQGLTEFLPVSSSAHLRVVPAVAGSRDPGSPSTAGVQLGTMARSSSTSGVIWRGPALAGCDR